MSVSLRAAIASGLAASRGDLDDPSPYEAYARKRRFDAPLYEDGISAKDVLQGQINDCYAVAAFAAIAGADPDTIKNAITDNGDGTFTVMFRKKGAYGIFFPAPVRVDSDLYVGSNDRPAFAGIGSDQWAAILEKAYAQFVGGYDVLDAYALRTQHLTAGDVFEALYGKPSTGALIAEDGKGDFAHLSVDELWKKVTTASKAKKPMVFVTFPKETAGDRYAASGIHASHNYSVLGYERGADGQRYLILRNPWGASEPGNDGTDDGIFKMKIEAVPGQFLAMCALG